MNKFLLTKALLLAAVCLFAQNIWAQDEAEECLALVYADSSQVDYFALSAHPVITFDDDATALSVTQDGEGAYSISDINLDLIDYYNFVDAVPTTGDNTGIGSILMDHALITGLKAGAQVNIYTVDGRMVSSATATQDGRVDVDFGALKSGQVYILSTPQASYKIVK